MLNNLLNKIKKNKVYLIFSATLHKGFSKVRYHNKI